MRNQYPVVRAPGPIPSTQVFIILPPSSIAASEKLEQQNNESHHQDNVDQTASYVKRKTGQPQDQEDQQQE
jgi:hypothetical protein